MSKFPKSARHPSVLGQVDNWRALKQLINVEDESQLSDIPDVALAGKTDQQTHDMEYLRSAREIIGANSIKALAKSYEALDALAECEREGISMSAMIQGYNASFFAARGFCMLMGFAPLDRDSKVTLDAFSQESAGRGKGQSVFEVLRLHKYKRWGHTEVWELTDRLIRTVEVPEELAEIHKWLKSAKLSDSSKVRNSFQYDDRRLAPINDSAYADFPDVVGLSIFDKDAPSELTHQFLVAKHLLQICLMVLDKSGINHLLQKCVSERRVRVAFECENQVAA